MGIAKISEHTCVRSVLNVYNGLGPKFGCSGACKQVEATGDVHHENPHYSGCPGPHEHQRPAIMRLYSEKSQIKSQKLDSGLYLVPLL